MYDEYSVVERRYAPLDVYKALTDNIYRSYGILNNVPQYMTNTDHPYTESGFLYPAFKDRSTAGEYINLYEKDAGHSESVWQKLLK